MMLPSRSSWRAVRQPRRRGSQEGLRPALAHTSDSPLPPRTSGSRSVPSTGHVTFLFELHLQLRHPPRRMLHLWHRVRDGTLRRSTFRAYMRPVQTGSATSCAGYRCPSRKVAGMCRGSSLAHSMDSSGTKASSRRTTPQARTAARQTGKSSYGTDSERGSRFVERMPRPCRRCAPASKRPRLRAGGLRSEASRNPAALAVLANMRIRRDLTGSRRR